MLITNVYIIAPTVNNTSIGKYSLEVLVSKKIIGTTTNTSGGINEPDVNVMPKIIIGKLIKPKPKPKASDGDVSLVDLRKIYGIVNIPSIIIASAKKYLYFILI